MNQNKTDSHNQYDNDKLNNDLSIVLIIVFIIIYLTFFVITMLLCRKKLYKIYLHKKKTTKVVPDNDSDNTLVKYGIKNTYIDKKIYIPSSCSICLDNYNDNDSLFTLNCKHTFHYQCVSKWFNSPYLNRISDINRVNLLNPVLNIGFTCPYCKEKF